MANTQSIDSAWVQSDRNDEESFAWLLIVFDLGLPNTCARTFSEGQLAESFLSLEVLKLLIEAFPNLLNRALLGA